VSLEDRLIRTLHRADDFEPSPDLFARVERSIEEDLQHRRRMRWVALSLIAGVLVCAAYLREVITVGPTGRLIAPGWALVLLAAIFQSVVVLTLGPTLRRFGRPFIADVFRLDSTTGERFVALLDIAFYLFFFGMILIRTEAQVWNQSIILGEDAWEWTAKSALFLIVMGMSHAFTIAVLPLIGLFHSSLMRRARRQRAGESAPPPSARAEQAERVVRYVVWGIGGLMMLSVLAGLGLFLLSGLST